VRILVGLALLPLLPLLLFAAPVWVFAAVVSALTALAVCEALAPVIAKKRLIAYAAVFSAAIPIWIYSQRFECAENAYWLPPVIISGFILLCFAEAIADYNSLKFTQISVIFTAAFFIPVCLSSLIRIADLPNGVHYIILPFIAALLSDICAYFTGVLWGKRKLTPVSPNKTIEGAAGGLIGTLVGMACYGLLQQFVFNNAVSYHLLLLYGLLGGAAGILGDLSMSLVKREFNIKDFGSLLPGHGGALDRFDSLLFAAPILEILIRLLPAIGGAA
jgi:phosphatidate cytidylyltransferase